MNFGKKKAAPRPVPKPFKAEELEAEELVFETPPPPPAPSELDATELLRATVGYLQSHPGGARQQEVVQAALAFLAAHDGS